MKRGTKPSKQIKRRIKNGKTKVSRFKPPKGNTENMISTGSTLLDLAISGGRVRGGGIPAGILVEIFGPSSSGKTVLLSEIAGGIQRAGGDVMFHDPEGRLNKDFAEIFDLNMKETEYSRPDTVPEVFQSVRKWEPSGNKVNGVFADSLAALSTDMEMDKEEGDKMGGRRAKEFSEELRKTCRVLVKNNYLMVASNQLRQNINTAKFGPPTGPKYKSPGGEALGFYSSLRLRTFSAEDIKIKRTYEGKPITRIEGVKTVVEVFKSSVWKPKRRATITIWFDYGIDDIRANLQFIKDHSRNTVYKIGDRKLDKSMDKSIIIVERDNLEDELKEQVIDLWEDIESKFAFKRKKKKR